MASPRGAGSSATRRSSTRWRSTRPSTGSPRAEAVARWVEQTPPEFVFAAKASRYMTHVKRLQNLADGIGRYYEGIEPLVESGKLGPIVWQFPAELQARRRPARTGAASPAARTPLLRVPARELVHRGRLQAAARARRRAGDRDHPRGPFQAHVLTADWTLRPVAPRPPRPGRQLLGDRAGEWARRIAEWRRRADVLVYFNNDWEGYAVRNAQALRRLLQRSPDA